jgi:predicted nucleic acid-binding protein
VLVIDASVAVLWYLPQDRTAAAAAVLSLGNELIGPLLLQLEVAAVLLRAVRQGDIDVEIARRGVFDVLPATVRMADEPGLAEAAYTLAFQHGGSFYDAVYIALARRLGADLVTDDVRMRSVALKLGVKARLLEGP